MNPDIAAQLSARHGWTVRVDNDANLAALAEGWQGAGRDIRNYVTLLTGDALGAGIVEEGRLLRGTRGGAGEMRFLEMVADVGSADGLTLLARDWARQALADPQRHPDSSLRDLADPHDGAGDGDGSEASALDAEAVFAAAEAGDALAVEIVERLGARFARIVSALAVLLDSERIVLAGGPPHACAAILPTVLRDLPLYVHPPLPEVVASELGAEAISTGTVRQSIAQVREQALQIELPRAVRDSAGPGSGD